jgi:hypothetical protein
MLKRDMMKKTIETERLLLKQAEEKNVDEIVEFV